MTASCSTRRGGGKNKKMVKNMKNEMKNENRDNVAAIGIGAMIVFIALILGRSGGFCCHYSDGRKIATKRTDHG